MHFCLPLLATLLTTSVANAAGIDLHAMWDSRCAQCHDHVDDLGKFMQKHYLPESEVEAFYNMLLAQTSTPPRFSKECGQCHGMAADLVRNSLELKNGVLFSRKSGQPVRNFLNQHMGLSTDDVEFYDLLLTRLAQEIYRP